LTVAERRTRFNFRLIRFFNLLDAFGTLFQNPFHQFPNLIQIHDYQLITGLKTLRAKKNHFRSAWHDDTSLRL
jgi:hypothetical protein